MSPDRQPDTETQAASRARHVAAIEQLPLLADDIEKHLRNVECGDARRGNSVRLAAIFASSLRNEIKHILR